MPDASRTPRLAVALLAGAAALIAGALAATAWLPGRAPPPDVAALLWPDPRPIAPFVLEDQAGRAFDRSRLEGRWTFLFFGFTNCPDVCPTTLAVLAQAVGRLEREPGGAAGVQVALVTVDPARDTREHLARYVAHFEPGFLGLRGTEEALAALTGQLGIVYHREPPDALGRYNVDHSAAILLADPAGRLIGVFGAPHDAARLAADFLAIRRFVEG